MTTAAASAQTALSPPPAGLRAVPTQPPAAAPQGRQAQDSGTGQVPQPGRCGHHMTRGGWCHKEPGHDGQHRRVTPPPPDNGYYLAMIGRMIRAAGRRVKAEDPSTLADLLALRAQIDAIAGDCARSLHDQGYSWGVISAELGYDDRHAAMKRWGRKAGG
jgi:hypothetical protein